MMDFKNRKCVPCEGGVEPLASHRVAEYLAVVPGWVADSKACRITRDLTLKDFTSVVELVNKIASLAEAEGHHPDLHIYKWNHLMIELSTHAIGGLSDNDFILAAKINALWEAQPTQAA